MPDAPEDPTDSLAPVRATIPPACRQASDLRGLAAVAIDVTAYGAVMVALVLVERWWLQVPLMAVAGVLVGSLFILGHDAAHGTLFTRPRANRVAARVLMLPSLHVTEAWVLGHNRIHHGYTTRQGMDFVWQPLTPHEYAGMSRLARLRHRIEWSAVGSGAYYGRVVWWRKMVRFRPPRKWAPAIRRDRRLVFGAAVVALLAAGALGWARSGTPAGAAWMSTLLVVGPFLVFTQVIGWTVYVHHISPAIAWASPKAWAPKRAQLESTTILRLPRLVNLFFHDIFVHVPHHVDTRIPWYRLREAAAALRSHYPDLVVERKLRLRDYLRTTRTCKLYDFDRQRWLAYKAARRPNLPPAPPVDI